MRQSRRFASISALIAIAFVLSLSVGTARADEPKAYLRAVHFLTGAPNLDIYLDHQAVLTNLAFQDATAYVTFAPGKHVLNFGVAGKGEGKDASAINLEAAAGDLFSFVFSGSLDDKTTLSIYVTSESGVAKQKNITFDDQSMPLLFVQGSVAAGAVDVYVNDALLGTAKTGESLVANVPIGAYKLKVTPAGDASKSLIDTAGFALGVTLGVVGLTGPADKLSLDYSLSSPQTADKFLAGQKTGAVVAFDTLLKAINAAKLSDVLTGPGPMTIFAPTDAAFAKLDPAALDKLMADPAALGEVLKYHILTSAVTFSDIAGLVASNGSAPTLQGASMPFSFASNIVIGGTPNPLMVYNIHLSNAIVHVINTVLMLPAK